MSLLRTSAAGAVVAGAAAAAAAACGSLVNPSAPPESEAGVVVAKLSGTLTAPLSGARLVLLWRAPDHQLIPGADVAIGASGTFAIDLTAPPDSYLFNVDPEDFAAEIGGTDIDWPYGAEHDAGSTDLQTVGAGFVVYQDTNQNGKFDFDPATRRTTDTLLGGADDLMLTYFKGGSPLDYEKMRSGLLPKEGFNVEWTTPEVWVALDTVQLKSDPELALPGTLCGDMLPFFTADVYDASTPRTYPPKAGSNVTCLANGLAFLASASATWNPTTCVDAPRTVCSSDGESACIETGIATGDWTAQYDAGQALPAGWPCNVTTPDGGK